MAYTFSSTTDDLSWSTTASGANAVGNTVTSLVMGWWLPTTLTAGRYLHGAGTSGVGGAAVAATTSEIELSSLNATTNGKWTTTGVGLTVDQWQFVAVARSFSNTGPAAAWRVWSGTNETAPVECTVTQDTAPAGNFTASATFTLGNADTTSSLGWQGDIDNVVLVATNTTVITSAIGTISNSDADLILANFVTPYWRDGTLSPDLRRGALYYVDLFQGLSIGSAATMIRRHAGSSTSSPEVTATPAGATPSQNRCPRALASSATINGYFTYPPGA